MSPCIRGEGKFTFFFYWDTCFTNLGLLWHGRAEIARTNCRNRQDNRQAARVAAKISEFERMHGIAATTDLPECVGCQWAFPNVWPPLVHVTIESLRRYGHVEDAVRIAGKFVETTCRLFEKPDARTGHIAGGEYEAAPMRGWTAGVFASCVELCDSFPESSTNHEDIL